jgi:hypothetical protein
MHTGVHPDPIMSNAIILLEYFQRVSVIAVLHRAVSEVPYTTAHLSAMPARDKNLKTNFCISTSIHMPLMESRKFDASQLKNE